MPHMARLPLGDFKSGNLDHTEVWEKSELETSMRLRNSLAEFSEDEEPKINSTTKRYYYQAHAHSSKLGNTNKAQSYLSSVGTFFFSSRIIFLLCLTEAFAQYFNPKHINSENFFKNLKKIGHFTPMPPK